MRDTYRKIIAILDSYERRRAIVLLVLFVGLGLAETLGVASVIPFMAVVADPTVIDKNRYLRMAYEYFEFSGYNEFLVFLGIAVFVFLLSSLAVSAGTRWFLFRFAQMCNYRISTRLLSEYFSRPYVWFLNQHSADLGKTVLDEVDRLIGQVVLPALSLISRVVAACLLLALTVAADPMIAMTAAAVLSGMYGLTYLAVRRPLVRIGADMYEANSERFKVTQETLGGIKDLKMSGLERAYLERYRGPAKRFSRASANHEIISTMPRYALEAVAFGGMLSLVIATLLTSEDGLGSTLPMIALYAFAGYRLLPSLQTIYNDLASIKFGTLVLERIHGELVVSRHQQPSYGPQVGEEAGALQLQKGLELRDVCFSYPGTRDPAIQNLNLTIPAGTTVAFVGSTGAGKTTAIDLILTLLTPDSGEIYVDGAPITAANRASWRRCIGYVPQMIFLVDGTIAANIALGTEEDHIDYDLVASVSRAAELHEFVMGLPEGYGTMVGERGVRLSGGQRQRIGIARALYRKPEVLVLDEATSALDNITERAVMKAVHNFGGTKTVILVAHRLSTVRECDAIFLMERGHVGAQGTYEELVENNATFRAMALHSE